MKAIHTLNNNTYLCLSLTSKTYFRLISKKLWINHHSLQPEMNKHRADTKDQSVGKSYVSMKNQWNLLVPR